MASGIDQTPLPRLDRAANKGPRSLRQSLLTQQLGRTINGAKSKPSVNYTGTIRLINVTRHRLVEFVHIPVYVALSYVWGRAELPQLTRSNLKVRSVEGALSV